MYVAMTVGGYPPVAAVGGDTQDEAFLAPPTHHTSNPGEHRARARYEHC